MWILWVNSLAVFFKVLRKSLEGKIECDLLYRFLNFIYLVLAVRGLHCYAWVFSSCGVQGLLFIAVCRLLISVASCVAEHRLSGTQASGAAA